MTEDTSAAAPADAAAPTVGSDSGAPPAALAGAVGPDGGTGTSAGAPIEEEVAGAPPANAVTLKIAPAAEGDPTIESLEVGGAIATGDYQPFTPAQASLLQDAAEAAGVTLLNQADEEATGGTSSP